MQSQPPPKGSLEDLFRHHLLESEAAAVPPRPLVWEHIDNSLLLAQNEKYRRRLLVHRWGMAASLLLASLAGGGWWHSQQVATATLASANAQRESARRAVAGAIAPGGRIATPGVAASGTTATNLADNGTKTAEGAGKSSRATGLITGNQADAATTRSELAAGAGQRPNTGYFGAVGRGYAGRSASTIAYGAAARPARGTYQAKSAAGARTFTFSSPNAHAIAGTSTSPLTSVATALAAGQPGSAVEANQPALDAANDLAANATSNRWGEAQLPTRLTALAVPAPTDLPSELAAKELSISAPTQLRRWRYGAEYAISAFQPNIDFNRSSNTYNSALGANTVSLTRAAAAEYRANLRPGLGQRVSLRATRWLGGHWSLSTGVEVAQQDAYSATSAAFTGEQLADLNSFAVSPSTGASNAGNTMASRDLRESSFRYRSAGVPLELQYDTQVKNGVSFYGRVGAIVSALLNARSEVAGNAEATRTYSVFSASSPYRRLTALLRGSAGVRYRQAGRGWGVHVGPTAEAGVQSLNTETDRSFLQQQRPYSVGLEAGFEFGGSLKPVPATN
jgi:hypothetical protein